MDDIESLGDLETNDKMVTVPNSYCHKSSHSSTHVTCMDMLEIRYRYGTLNLNE